MEKIGFIGLGHMGHPMAENLLNAGYTLYVYDINPEALKRMEQIGAKALAPSEIAKVADALITSVQTGEQVEKLCYGEAGLFNHLSPGKLFIDCSSIDITTCKALHLAATKHKIAMLDAPVSGGVAGAVAGTLTIMVGGSDAHYQLALPILEKIGKKIVYAGGAGMGQAAKICNNLLLAISMIGVSEAFNLAANLGLDLKKFFEISSNASGQCWSMTTYCPVPDILPNTPSSHQYQPGFMAKMMLKDLHLGQKAAVDSQTAIPLGDVSTELYASFVNQGHGEIDFSGIINYLKNVK